MKSGSLALFTPRPLEDHEDITAGTIVVDLNREEPVLGV